MELAGYIDNITLEYPLYEGDIRLRHPEIGEEFILPEKYSPVYFSEFPQVSEKYTYKQSHPQSIDGVWYTTWEIIPAVTKRNQRLINAPDVYNQTFRENVWANGTLYRTAYSVDTTTGESILQNLVENFPDEVIDSDKLNWIGYNSVNVRPPYTNSTISFYIWKNIPDEIRLSYNIMEKDIMPWYGKKYDLTTKEIMIKVPFNDPYVGPEDLPLGTYRFYGKIYRQNGTVDNNIDYYVACPTEEIREYCARHGFNFPCPDDALEYVNLWSIVYKSDTLTPIMVKAYDIRNVTRVD